MRDHRSLHLELRPSRHLLVIGGAAHGLAAVAVVIASLPLWAKAGFIVGTILSLRHFVTRYGNRHGRGFIRRIELLDGRWRLETGDGTQHRARFDGGYAHPQLVIVNFRLDNGQRRALTLLPDAADTDALRALRVWLRTQREADETDPP